MAMPAPSSSHRIRHLAIAAGALALFAAAVWVAVQGGLWPQNLPSGPTAGLRTQILGKVAGVAYILIGSLPVLASFWLGVAGLGLPVRRLFARQIQDRIPIQLAAGLGLMLLADWGLGLAGWLNPWTAWGLCTVGTLLFLWHLTDAQRRGLLQIERWPNPPWTVLLGLPVLGLILVACACPPGTLWSVEAFGYDVLSYHLELPREWLAAGRISGLHYNVYSYLPNLVEAGYMHLGAMSGSIYSAIYTTQLFDASVAGLAAWLAACLVRRYGGSPAAALAGVVFLATPWVLIAATLPYDEMVGVALGSAAFLLLLDDTAPARRVALWAGLLLGAATLAKLPMGAMLVPAAGLMVLLHLDHPPRVIKQETQPATASGIPPKPSGPKTGRSGGTLVRFGLVAAGVLLAVSPYLIRNAVWTGNPVFPEGIGLFGRGYWGKAQAQRWEHAHHPAFTPAQALRNLADRWLLDAGFGGVGPVAGPGSASGQEAYDITRFPRTGLVPALWLSALLGAILALRSPVLRRPALAMLLIIAVSLAVWVLATHQQSRFLIPTIWPACVLVGLGMHVAGRLRPIGGRLGWSLVWALILTGLLSFDSFDIFFHQTALRRVAGPEASIPPHLMHLPPWLIVDSLPVQRNPTLAMQDGALPGDHVINNLPPDSRTLIVADATVFYIRRPISYHSAFDPDPLGALIRASQDDAPKVTARLKAMGFTNVWVNWSELDRLHRTYGYDPDVTARSVSSLAQRGGWRVLANYGWATLFALR